MMYTTEKITTLIINFRVTQIPASRLALRSHPLNIFIELSPIDVITSLILKDPDTQKQTFCVRYLLNENQ
jgi:hypothetical protein